VPACRPKGPCGQRAKTRAAGAGRRPSVPRPPLLGQAGRTVSAYLSSAARICRVGPRGRIGVTVHGTPIPFGISLGFSLGRSYLTLIDGPRFRTHGDLSCQEAVLNPKLRDPADVNTGDDLGKR